MDVVCPAPKSQPAKLLENPAVHFKGSKRKPFMVDYYRLLEEKWRAGEIGFLVAEVAAQ